MFPLICFNAIGTSFDTSASGFSDTNFCAISTMSKRLYPNDSSAANKSGNVPDAAASPAILNVAPPILDFNSTMIFSATFLPTPGAAVIVFASPVAMADIKVSVLIAPIIASANFGPTPDTAVNWLNRFCAAIDENPNRRMESSRTTVSIHNVTVDFGVRYSGVKTLYPTPPVIKMTKPSWHNIQHKKGAVDAARSGLFTKLAREITMAAKLGDKNPDNNPRLRLAILNARKNSMPNDNIKRAIDKASGANTENYVAVRYEGYGPGAVPVIVEALTDNPRRTVPEIRNIFAKNGGNMGEEGSVKRAVLYLCSHAPDKSFILHPSAKAKMK